MTVSARDVGPAFCAAAQNGQRRALHFEASPDFGGVAKFCCLLPHAAHATEQDCSRQITKSWHGRALIWRKRKNDEAETGKTPIDLDRIRAEVKPLGIGLGRIRTSASRVKAEMPDAGKEKPPYRRLPFSIVAMQKD
jgi:hypothetical protein